MQGLMTPKGWKLVPIEPTTEMTGADPGTCTTDNHAFFTAKYRAMLATSPPPPVEGSAPALERLPVAFEVLDIELGTYLTRSEEAAIKSGHEYNGLYRRAALSAIGAKDAD